MERDETENLVGDRVRAVVSEKQNELLDGINSMLSAKFDIMEKNFCEKQSALSENQISRLRSSALGQYQFKQKSCEEQFHFNASVEDKVSDIDCSLANLNAESVERAKKSVSEGKSLIQQRQKMLKLADSSELGWKVVSEYQANPLASDSEDEQKSTRPKTGRSERHVRNSRKSYLLESSHSGRDSIPQHNLYSHNHKRLVNQRRLLRQLQQRAADLGTVGGGHWRSEC